MCKRSKTDRAFVALMSVFALMGFIGAEICLEELLHQNFVGVPLFQYLSGIDEPLASAVGGISFLGFFLLVSLCIMGVSLFIIYDTMIAGKE